VLWKSKLKQNKTTKEGEAMFKKGAFTAALVVLLILGLTASALANPAKGNSGWKFKAKAKVNGVQFNDIGNHWAEQSIKHISSMGIISGYPDKKFLPNAPVSRYEALMMICRASGFEPDMDETYAQRLEDCLEYAVSEDIIDDDEGFDGWKPAKRYEVAVWAIRASGLEYEGNGLTFVDIDEIPDLALPYISVMFKHKYMVGYPGNFFQPNKPVTRAEIVVIMNRMMDGDYVDGDESGLRLSSLDPADGESNVNPDTHRLVARFNGDIEAVEDLQDVKAGITVRNVTDGDNLDIDSVSIDGKVLTIELDDPLSDDCKYRVTIEEDIIKAEGSSERFDGISGSEWDFSTFSDADINLTNLDPDDGENNVDLDTGELVAVFNMDIEAAVSMQDVKSGTRVRNITDGVNVDIDDVSIDGNELTIELGDSLEGDKVYRVTIEQDVIGAQDSAGYFDGIKGGDWEFSTADEGGISLKSLSPANGASSVDPDTRKLKAFFEDDISAVSGKDLSDAVRVYNVDREIYEGIDEVEIDGDTLVITLDDNLGYSDTFEVTIKAGYLEDDNSGEDYGGLDGDDWHFTTD
jgi:hypothetical protein